METTLNVAAAVVGGIVSLWAIHGRLKWVAVGLIAALSIGGGITKDRADGRRERIAETVREDARRRDQAAREQIEGLRKQLTAAIATATANLQPKPSTPPTITVFLRYAGQWPGYTNAMRVPLDESARLSMRVGETQGIFPSIGGSGPLSNVSIDMCVPRNVFKVLESPEWEPADDDRGQCPGALRFSSYIGAVNPQQAINPKAIQFRAISPGARQFQYWVTSHETPLINRAFRVQVTP